MWIQRSGREVKVLPRQVFPEGLMSSCRTEMSNTLAQNSISNWWGGVYPTCKTTMSPENSHIVAKKSSESLSCGSIPQKQDMKNRLVWPLATLLCIQVHYVNSKEMRPKELPQLTTSYAALHPDASLKFHIFYMDGTGGIAVSDHQLCCYASRCITLQVHGTGQCHCPRYHTPSLVKVCDTVRWPPAKLSWKMK